MNCMISVIVPVYNVEKYVERCIDSIMNQTYKNIEVIVVDDGSTDKSLEIIKNKYKKNKKISIYHKSNGGLSSARNYGLEKCNGEYIAFIDSDDWIDPDCIEKVVKCIQVNDFPEIVEFGYRKVNDNIVIEEKKLNNNVYKETNILDEYFYGNQIVDIVCNKFYKKDLFESVRFVEQRIHEDYMIMPELLYKSKKICTIHDVFYNYYERDNSITKSRFKEKNFDRIYAGNYVIDFCKKNIPQYTDIAKIKCEFICIYMYSDLISSNRYLKKIYKSFKKRIAIEYNKLYYETIKTKSFKKLPFHKKMMIKLFKYNKYATVKIYKVLRG